MYALMLNVVDAAVSYRYVGIGGIKIVSKFQLI